MIDDMDWHARVLLRAFAEMGADAKPVRVADCAFDSLYPHGLAIPGFVELPDAVFVRAIGGGSFEEVTRRLGILHALRELEIPVWNDARAIERCVDKSTTSFLLALSGLPTPPTWAVEGLATALEVLRRELPHGRLVLKPLFGSQGQGLRLIEQEQDLPPPEVVGGVYYLQRYVPPTNGVFEDRRLFVCGSAVIAAMTRRAESWITNIHQGGRPEPVEASGELADLAVRAAAVMGAHYAGVDMLRGADGRTVVLEVNSMPGWRALQKVAPTDIAGRLVTALLNSLG
ncbi:MAG: RimK family alpha-L-glutamate ligase [Acetobacteraceae bacterium]|nr:RimK family alpha-L-glutamate ligase [Acetobacteraceae bacterium]